MKLNVRTMKPPVTGTETARGKPRPIRPQGISLRQPLLLFVAIVAGLFFGYRYLTGSEPYRMAETFVRQNVEIKNAVGEVRTCRLWFPFTVDIPDGALQVDFTLLVEGAKANTKAYVSLKRAGAKWRIVSASYEDGKGTVRPLLKKEKPSAPKSGAV